MDVTAAVVNYGTPDLTRAAVWSLRGLYPNLGVLVVENGSPDDSKARLGALAKEAGGVTLLTPGENLHHGPGMDLAIRRAPTPASGPARRPPRRSRPGGGPRSTG